MCPIVNIFVVFFFLSLNTNHIITTSQLKKQLNIEIEIMDMQELWC